MATIRRRNRKYKWEAQVRVKGFKKTYKSFHIKNEYNRRLHFSHINKLYHREKKNLIAIN